jgi:predicted enzyme related to lactoylglutathione lyase
MNAPTAGHDASVQMIDTSIVRVHQHGACVIRKAVHATVTRWAHRQDTCGGDTNGRFASR